MNPESLKAHVFCTKFRVSFDLAGFFVSCMTWARLNMILNYMEKTSIVMKFDFIQKLRAERTT